MIDRQKSAKLLIKLFKDQDSNVDVNVSSNPFTDTEDKDIIRLKQLGIVNGYKDGSFKPNEKVSKEAFLMMLANSAKKFNSNIKVSPDIEKFNDDANIATWAKDDIYMLKSLAIVSGVNNKLNPKDNITYQEAIVLTVNFYETFIPKIVYPSSSELVVLGESFAEIENRFTIKGEHKLSDNYIVYNLKENPLLSVGIYNNKVSSIYADSKYISFLNYNKSSTKDDLELLFKQDENNIFAYQFSDFYSNITIHQDVFSDINFDSIYIESKDLAKAIENDDSFNNTDFLKNRAKIMNSTISSYRMKNNVYALTWNDKIAQMAQNHSDELRNNKFLDYRNRKGETVLERYKNAKIPFNNITENIYKGGINIYNVAYEWINNPGNRASILSNDYRQSGVGISNDDDLYYYVQDLTN